MSTTVADTKLKPLPPLELLETLFEINAQSPSGLIWKKPRCLKLKPGDNAGFKNKEGYWDVGVKTETSSKIYKVHRIIYYLHYKNNIDLYFIDHKDGNRSNNKIDNLRLVTNQQNSCNKKKKDCFTSKYKGVDWSSNDKKWRAQICVKYKKYHLGLFNTELEAAQAYNEAASKYHAHFAVLNNV